MQNTYPYTSNLELKTKLISSHPYLHRTLTVIKKDKAVFDYYMRLTTFFGEYRAVGVNYNQVVKALNANFSEKKAMALLYKLEQATIQLVHIQQKTIELTKEFNEKYSVIK